VSGRATGLPASGAPTRNVGPGPPGSARPLQLGVLLLGVLAVSTGAVLVRGAQAGAPSLTIAAGRLALAALLVTPLALARHRATLARLTARQLGLALLAGAFLAGHFAFWITSLEHTSVVSSVVLVCSTPLWVGLLAPLVLRERLTRRVALGILLAFAGGIVVGLGDAGGATAAAPRGRALLGDSLALAGAWMMAGNLLVGRRLRAGLGLVPYVAVVYSAAAVILLVLMAAAGQDFLGLSPATCLWIALLALVPQLLGHSSFYWALRWLPASLVAVALLGEPVGSSLLAWALLREVPGPLTLAGAAVILAGIAVVAWSSPAATSES
jgi:drug/metabolite transporter (DMT)-like permease